MELSAAGDKTRLEPAELRALSPILESSADATDALLIVEDGVSTTKGDDARAIDIVINGQEESPLASAVSTLDETGRTLALTEATLTAWRQRLSDAADVMPALTSEDANEFGQIAITGKPLITGLHAEQRRLLRARISGGDALVGDQQALAGVIDAAIDELFASIRFGLAAASQTDDGEFTKAIKRCLDTGQWGDQLRFLVVAQEIRAIQLLLTLDTDNRDSASGLASARNAFDQCTSQRLKTGDISEIISVIVSRLPEPPLNIAARLRKRHLVRDAEQVRERCLAYASAFASPDPDSAEHMTWQQALDELLELDRVVSTDIALLPAIVQDPEQTAGPADFGAEEAAELLGELFSQQLPRARESVSELQRQHPGADADTMIRIVKRQFMIKLQDDLHSDNPNQRVVETVACLTMAFAIVRGVVPHSGPEFTALGERIILGTTKITAMYGKADAAQSAVFAGVTVFAKYFQRDLVELVFSMLGAFKPGQAGVARDLFKILRSRVWRARFDKRVGNAAGMGAAAAFKRGIDVGAPRLIVRLVDRAMR
ncbi:hypothetical protein [Gordonia sp. ABSL49_1]|uniref:hypothetical protein n=1 Tax=Gordonia sp. ABSL49_1 TaxID=2920941 RepID=UPI001F0D6E90|nr:hypothetical protein [Gordonia sp. ABSL49_1]MCH5645629.1 hypothetical protein [Gordonia sp. ABSL49_1]